VGAELRSLSHNHGLSIRSTKPLFLLMARLALVMAGSYDKAGQSRNAGLFVADAATGQSGTEVGKYDVPGRSPDGKSLLAGFYGENGGSGDPQNDYFLLNPATQTWTPELTARGLLWLQGEAVLYLRPFETTPLAPASPRSVWTSQFAIYDLASHKDTALTSGLVLNDYLSTCSR
jgi:hypothetical protein